MLINFLIFRSIYPDKTSYKFKLVYDKDFKFLSYMFSNLLYNEMQFAFNFNSYLLFPNAPITLLKIFIDIGL